MHYHPLVSDVISFDLGTVAMQLLVGWIAISYYSDVIDGPVMNIQAFKFK